MKKRLLTVLALMLVIGITAFAGSVVNAPATVYTEPDENWGYDASDIVGDINSDYTVNVKDMVRLKKYIAYKDTASQPYINTPVCDYDGNNDVNGDDLITLRKQILSGKSESVTVVGNHTVGALDSSKVDTASLMTLSQTSSDAMLKNYGKGWYVYGDPEDKDVPFKVEQSAAWEYASVGYIRYHWSTIEPAEGQYDWAYIDNAISYCKERGARFAFGIMSADPSSDKEYVTPKWVFDAGAKYYETTVNNTIESTSSTQFIPDFSDDIYVSRVQNLANALAERYGNDSDIEFIDIRCYGSWGENNMYDIPDLYKDQPDTGVNADDMWRCWETYINAFEGKKARLVVAYSLGENALKDVFERAINMGVSIRNDGVLHWNHIDKEQASNNLWGKNKVPTIIELAASYGNLRDKYVCWDSEKFEATLSTATSYYPLGGAWYTDAKTFITDQEPLIKRMSNLMGYHLSLNEIKVSNTLGAGSYDALYMNFKNSGNAPVLFDTYIAAALLDSKGNAVDVCWLDGVNISDVTPSGDITDADKSVTLASPLVFNKHNSEYRLAIGIFTSKDLTNPDIKIANTGVLENGWCVIYNPDAK